MKKAVIIVAGGSGVRMGSKIPKQFLELNGEPVLMHTLRRFHSYDPLISQILVLPLREISLWEKMCSDYGFDIPHETVVGGSTRYDSVKSGLSRIQPGALTAIHDGVRPLVSRTTIHRCFSTALSKGNAIPALSSRESVRYSGSGKNRPLDRRLIHLIQTPQVFQWDQIRDAYLQPYNELFTDDASVVEKLGHRIHLVEGNPENIKITTPLDLQIAATFLREDSLK